MEQNILNRYDKLPNGELVIKISTTKIEDLYNNFDMNSSFLKKDLNDDLITYLIDSVSEISEEKFILKFYFEENITELSRKKVINSIDRYFRYLEELEKKKMKEQIKNSFIFMAIGLFFITCSILIGKQTDLAYEIIAEGTMVAGWVSFWEAMATILIKWVPLKKKLKVFKKIIESKIEFSEV